MRDTKDEIEVAYDKEADVLYVSLGKPAKAESEEVQNGVFARYSPTGACLG